MARRDNKEKQIYKLLEVYPKKYHKSITIISEKTNGFMNRFYKDIESELVSQHELSEHEKAYLRIMTNELREAIGDLSVIIADELKEPHSIMEFLNTTELIIKCSLFIGAFTSFPDVLEFQTKLVKSKQGSIGGKKGGESKRKKAEETWHKTALELANKSRIVDPSLSLDDVAFYVLDNWNSKEFSCVGHTRLKQVISRWIKEKKLPEKVRQ